MGLHYKNNKELSLGFLLFQLLPIPFFSACFHVAFGSHTALLRPHQTTDNFASFQRNPSQKYIVLIPNLAIGSYFI